LNGTRSQGSHHEFRNQDRNQACDHQLSKCSVHRSLPRFLPCSILGMSIGQRILCANKRFLQPSVQLHHPRPSETEVVLTGTAHDDAIQDTDADVLQGLGDLVGGVDVLFRRVRFLSAVRPW
jgi:hypothetical protein